MIEIIKVLRIERLDEFRLRLHFSDGSVGDRDFFDIVGEGGPMVEPLREPGYFARVFLELGTLTWPNGFDIDSIALHQEMKAAGLLRVPAA